MESDSLWGKVLFLVWHRFPAGESAGWKPTPRASTRT